MASGARAFALKISSSSSDDDDALIIEPRSRRRAPERRVCENYHHYAVVVSHAPRHTARPVPKGVQGRRSWNICRLPRHFSFLSGKYFDFQHQPGRLRAPREAKKCTPALATTQNLPIRWIKRKTGIIVGKRYVAAAYNKLPSFFIVIGKYFDFQN